MMLTLSLLLATFASADAGCPSLAEVSAKITFCSHNGVAFEAGQTCAERIRADWARASQEIRNTLGELKKASKDQQQNQLATSRASYASAVKKLNDQISSMQRDTALVASYSQAMIDFADSNEDEPPATCFTENFDKLQQVVTGLDKDIIQAKRVYKETVALKSAAHTGTVDMSSVAGKTSLDLKAKPAPGAAPTMKMKDRQSDVSGIPENEAIRAKEKQKK